MGGKRITSTGSEKRIEGTLRRQVEKRGGICLKFASQTATGYPDRICLLPGGRCVFVELKSTGCRPAPLQRQQMARLHRLGFEAHVIDTLEGVRQFINRYWSHEI